MSEIPNICYISEFLNFCYIYDDGADPAQLTFPPQVVLQDIDESDADSDVEDEYDSGSGN